MNRFLNYLLNKRYFLSFVMLFLSDSKKTQIYIARFKAELSSCGMDVSDMTDEEIIEGINRMGDMVAQCGMTTDEVTKAFKALANCP